MSVVGIEEFVARIEQSKLDVKEQLLQFLILFILDCVEEVVVGGEYGPGTPVDTGFLRAMWWLSINGAGASPNLAPASSKEKVPFDFTELSVTILELQLGDNVSLNNNTEYAEYVEAGSSSQAPQGMVEVVVNAAPAIAQRRANQMGWEISST